MTFIYCVLKVTCSGFTVSVFHFEVEFSSPQWYFKVLFVYVFLLAEAPQRAASVRRGAGRRV